MWSRDDDDGSRDDDDGSRDYDDGSRVAHDHVLMWSRDDDDGSRVPQNFLAVLVDIILIGSSKEKKQLALCSTIYLLKLYLIKLKFLYWNLLFASLLWNEIFLRTKSIFFVIWL